MAPEKAESEFAEIMHSRVRRTGYDPVNAMELGRKRSVVKAWGRGSRVLLVSSAGSAMFKITIARLGTPMRPAEVQTDDIIKAGQQLESQGRPVNGWNLRRALGDRGRPDHLIEEWQTHQGTAQIALEDEELLLLPPELAEQADRGRSELAAHYDGLVLAMLKQTDALLSDRYKAEFDRLTAERGEMQDQLAAASASVGATEAALNETLVSMERMREALNAARTGIAHSEKRVRAVEEQRQRDAQAAGQQITALQAQVAALNAAAQHTQKKMAATESEAQHLREQVTRLTASVETTCAEAAAMSAEAKTAKAERAADQRRADRMEQECAAAQKNAAAAHEAAATSKNEAQQLRERVAQLASALGAARDLVTTIRAEVAAAKSNITVQQQRAEKAEQDLAHARDERRKSEDSTGIIYIT